MAVGGSDFPEQDLNTFDFSGYSHYGGSGAQQVFDIRRRGEVQLRPVARLHERLGTGIPVVLRRRTPAGTSTARVVRARTLAAASRANGHQRPRFRPRLHEVGVDWDHSRATECARARHPLADEVGSGNGRGQVPAGLARRHGRRVGIAPRVAGTIARHRHRRGTLRKTGGIRCRSRSSPRSRRRGAIVPAPHRQATNGRRRAGLHEGGLGAVRPAISRFLLTDGCVSVTAILGRPSRDRHQVEQ